MLVLLLGDIAHRIDLAVFHHEQGAAGVLVLALFQPAAGVVVGVGFGDAVGIKHRVHPAEIVV